MLDFLYYPIAFVLKLWHSLWGSLFDPHSGVSWVLAIMFLVVTVRIILFPLFVKMIKSQRAMQELQPEIAKLRAEYGSDRQGMSEAMMKLQRERGVNPLAGCLPMIAQAPVFIALLHVLRRLEPGKPGLYSWDDALTDNAATATVFGAPISSYFTMSGDKLDALLQAVPTTSSTNIKVVTGILIVVMSITQFITTKQIMKRTKAQNANMPESPQAGQMQMVQKLMLYGAPLALLISGTFFPLGVLLYWFFNNLWTMGQQFWVLSRMPAPGARPEDKDKAEIDRTKLAPRPGAKPNRDATQRPRSVAASTTDEPEAEALADDAADTGSRSAGTKPPGSAKSSRSGGKPGGSAKPRAGAKPAAGSRAQTKRKKR
ncbi:MAG: membrane protein insertase YidC [Cumulibacter sp.]